MQGPAPALRAVLQRTTARLGLQLLSVVLIFLVTVPWLSNHDVMAAEGAQLLSPSSKFWLGTDQMGRDVMIRVAAGGRRSIGGAVLALTAAVSVGLLVGVLSASAGRARGRSAHAGGGRPETDFLRS